MANFVPRNKPITVTMQVDLQSVAGVTPPIFGGVSLGIIQAIGLINQRDYSGYGFWDLGAFFNAELQSLSTNVAPVAFSYLTGAAATGISVDRLEDRIYAHDRVHGTLQRLQYANDQLSLLRHIIPPTTLLSSRSTDAIDELWCVDNRLLILPRATNVIAFQMSNTTSERRTGTNPIPDNLLGGVGSILNLYKPSGGDQTWPSVTYYQLTGKHEFTYNNNTGIFRARRLSNDLSSYANSYDHDDDVKIQLPAGLNRDFGTPIALDTTVWGKNHSIDPRKMRVCYAHEGEIIIASVDDRISLSAAVPAVTEEDFRWYQQFPGGSCITIPTVDETNIDVGNGTQSLSAYTSGRLS